MPLQALVSTEEPGPRLTVEGRVIDAATGEPVEGARLVVYQADQAGTYQPEDPADESTARIRGELITGSNGEFSFVTVQPGEYPDQPPGNRHIHFHSVTAPGYAPKGFVLLFDDNVRSDVREWAESTGFGIVVPVTGNPTSGLAATIEVPLDPEA
jgi:protocatechuate 3,4-dioxygenase beta subunit